MVDEALLRYYAQEWDRYTTGANYVNRLFTYLNRHWVKREKDEGRKNVYQVYTVRPALVPAYPSIAHPFAIAGFGPVEAQLLPPCSAKANQTRIRCPQAH